MKKHILAENYKRFFGTSLIKETKDSGLYVYFDNNVDANKAFNILEDEGYYSINSDNETFVFLPEEPSMYDSLEKEVTDLFNKYKIQSYRFEGV